MTGPQEKLYERLKVTPDGWMFIRGPETRVAQGLKKLGLAHVGSRNTAGQEVPAWSRGFRWTLERDR